MLKLRLDNMKYNFDKIASRRNTSSIKWDVKENELPMWVADMDFLVMPEIQEAISDAAKSNGFGYTYPTKEYFEAYRYWWSSRHHIDIDTSSMIFVSGVVSALDSIIRKLTNEDDKIMILSPVYHAFYNVIKNNKRKVVTSSLLEENNYSINYLDIEEQFKTNEVKALIFCNPHNPVGRIWEKEEIKKLYDLCEKYHVIMVSDEIHCDIVDPGYEYNSALSVNEDIITCLSPGKVFNLAGIHSAVVVAKNDKYHKLLQLAFYRDDIGEPNYFAIPANIVAYTKGAKYVDELNQYLYKNKEYVSIFIKDNLPQIRLVEGHATYLLWLDISSLNMRSDVFCKELQEETGLILSPGIQFGEEGAYYLRMNIATSLDNVKDAMNRMKKYIASKEK